ncbi:DUF5672 family protein [Dyadobacter psychrophilus]|uniref:DUF5672 domain-containing protein n=1 Tax=Dyadobacter psychrophilus TaxID=651661 RepID=A0A1T5H821_9BACT|nr:DUF5672 family protein [Dyadobacter psychrophilus]SKC16826.1 hypothetical protein SAMN05660293_05049 [Dyadobacter psychrophilus]
MKSSKAKSSVAVVIPVYKSVMSDNEKLSLMQCMEVLGTYPVKIVKPASLDLNAVKATYPNIELVSFDDVFFADVAAYNRLMISIDFYKKFLAYEYILIYQLDAYVFHDSLLEWCAKGFDYIGAPSLHLPAFDSLKAASYQQFADALSTHRVVFNGGLSLRRIPAIIRYLKIYNAFYPAWVGNEDMLFSQEATRLIPMKLFLKLPSWHEALGFAFEKSPAATYEITQHKLPFGCHAWERYDPQFWSTFIVENQ